MCKKIGNAMDFVIGSTNKAKVQAATEVIHAQYPSAHFEARNVDSSVSDQPFGDEETMAGAVNRAIAAAGTKSGAIGIGFEGGVRMVGRQMYLCNWGALALPDGKVFTAAGAQIPLPLEIAERLLAGDELGPVVDRYFQASGIPQREGAIGMFTAHLVKRNQLFEHILLLLLGQFEFSENQN
ncbi:DUF84 family protein [Sporosarcina sp. FSL W7-1349]|uniref:DUF84 family protein n=1 Tax=Sporosarcina sp. FSL W7-1349 TaxID=2921561 RepID=UPI0030F8B23A